MTFTDAVSWPLPSPGNFRCGAPCFFPICGRRGLNWTIKVKSNQFFPPPPPPPPPSSSSSSFSRFIIIFFFSVVVTCFFFAHSPTDSSPDGSTEKVLRVLQLVWTRKIKEKKKNRSPNKRRVYDIKKKPVAVASDETDRWLDRKEKSTEASHWLPVNWHPSICSDRR